MTSSTNTSSFRKLKAISKLIPFLNSVAIYFILFLPSDEPSWFSMLIKCLPIVSLMLFVVLHGISLHQPEHTLSRRILLGLIFSCVGDAFLVWPNYFLEGMLAFGVTQVIYISAFEMKPLNLDLGVILYVIAALGVAILEKNLKGVFIVGVPLYAFLLTTMTWRTIARLGEPESWVRYATCVGGLLWLVSDALLGFHLFYTPLPYSQGLIMGTYYMGQLGIALSVSEQHSITKRHSALKKGVHME